MGTTATVAVLFCDTVGSTERLTRLGDVAGDAFRRRLFAELRTCIGRTRGTEVKNLGDGLMVVFEHSTVDALACARLMHERAAEVEPADPVELRIGISAGEVGTEDGDWFGTPVVEAARLCGVAGSGRTLAPALVRTLVGSRATEHSFRPVGPVGLKGLPLPLDVVEVDGPDDPGEDHLRTGHGVVSPDARSRRRHRRGPTVAVGVVAVLLVGGLAGVALVVRGGSTDLGSEAVGPPATDVAVTEPRGYEPVLEPRPCQAEVLDAAPAAECADLVVPEDRDHLEGRRLRLPVTSVAGPAGPTADPVLLLDVNEPVGASSLTDGAQVHSLTLRGFEPGSEPRLSCPELSEVWTATFARRAEDSAAIEDRARAAGACAARLRAAGVRLEGYDMGEAAADLRDLALALGEDRVTVAAGGYTTTAAAALARSSPGLVGAMLLTNPTPPGESALAEPAAALAGSFDALVELCAGDPGCAATSGDLATRYAARQQSLDAEPRLVTTRALDGSGPYQVLLDGRRFAAAVESAVRASDRVGLVPSAVSTASDELIAAASISEEIGFFAGPGALAAATLSFTCSHDAEPNRTAEITDVADAAFAGANEPSFQRLCEAWGVPSTFRSLSQPLDTDVPVLLAEGGLAVAGVNDWSEEMAELLPGARVVRFATMSDDLSFVPPPCLRDLRAAFVADPQRSVDVDRCEEESPAVEFSGAGP